MPKKTARLKIDLILEVAGKQFRCADFSWNFGLNRVPTAKATLAIGRDVRTLQKAIIHTQEGLDAVKMFNLAKVYFFSHGEWEPGDHVGFSEDVGRWDEVGDQMIFEGYVTGVGYHQQRGVTRFSVQLIHWLADLHFSSCLTNQTHPGSAARFNWRGVFGPSGAHTTPKSYFIAHHVASPLFSRNAVTTDLWGESMHKLLCTMTEQELPREGGTSCGDLSGGNPTAARALSRIERDIFADGEEIGKDCEEGARSPYHVKLAMDMTSAPMLVAQSISTWIGLRTIQSFFTQSMWDKIVGVWGPMFDFDLVPKVKTAQIVPFVPGLRTPWQKTLDMADITYLDTTALIPRPLRGVAILVPLVSSFPCAAQDSTPFNHVGGCWAPRGDAQGMVRYMEPKFWLSCVPAHASEATATALPSPVSKPPPGAGPFWVPDSTPAATGGETTPQAPGKLRPAATAVETINAMREYYDKHAHAEYVKEMLRGRYAVAQGKLRWDIAPGSTIKIVNRGTVHIPKDALRSDLFATVSRVGGVISAEAKNAGTTFQLEHVRTEAENEDDATSTAEHPLYNTVFPGAPLIHEYLFPDE